MCCFRELSVQSGVSSVIRSKMTALAITCPGFLMSSFKMAYSVFVSFTGQFPTDTSWEEGSSFKSSTESMADRPES